MRVIRADLLLRENDRWTLRFPDSVRRIYDGSLKYDRFIPRARPLARDGRIV